jgi:hypothetical protein
MEHMKTATACAALTLLLAIPAHAKTSTAERFDTLVRVQPGGALDVTETIVFRFESGTFRDVVRVLPARRNNGVEVTEVWMDGRRIAIGEGPGQAAIEGAARNRVRWRFPPASGSTHTFRVRYLVHGGVRQDARGDLLAWRVPGGEHRWAIESSTVDFELPAGVPARASVDARRAGTVSSTATATGARTTARGVRSDGWTDTTLVMPAASIVAEAPAWQVAERQRSAYAKWWLSAAGIVFFAGLMPLFGLRQGYEAPPRPDPGAAPPPASWFAEPLPPGIAGAVAAHGRPSLEHAAAALFALADRGVVVVKEEKRGALGTRTYSLTRAASRHALAPHEEAVLDTVFASGDQATVTLSTARSRLTRRFSRFSRALIADLQASGLLDPGRQATRRAYLKVSALTFVLAGATFAGWIFTMERWAAWPLTIPAALVCTALTALIMSGTTTALSNEGVHRARHWRAYKDHVKAIAKHRSDPAAASQVALPYAVALGLSAEWSKYLKAQPGRTPEWFHSPEGADGYSAFVAAAGAGPAQAHAH